MNQKHIILLTSLILMLGFSGCKDASREACLKDRNLHACNDVCDVSGDKQACAMQTEIGLEQCVQKGDLKTCADLCLFAKDGSEVFCKKQKDLCALPANSAAESCQMM